MERHLDSGVEFPKIKVFISHAWIDKQFADQLYHDLETVGVDPWIDYRNLRLGDSIQSTIDEALSQIDLVLVVWTEHSAQSKNVRAEIKTCLDLGLRVVPCFIDYDDRGYPNPPLSKDLEALLGVDFHHYGTGLATLAQFILELQNERLPAEASLDQNPGMPMLHLLKGYLGYLSNYRNLRGVQDDRPYWVGRIINEIERYVAQGGNQELVESLLEVARRSEMVDPEGVGMLVTRLEAVLEQGSLANEPSPTRAKSLGEMVRERGVQRQISGQSAWRKPASPPADELTRQVTALVPQGTADAWLEQVNAYLDSAPIAIQLLSSYSQGVKSQAFSQVVNYLHNYLTEADDLMPDRLGRYGLLDDAWLILNTTFRLLESGLLPAQAAPLNWNVIVNADPVVRAIIPPDALTALTNIIFQMLQMIAQEINAYQPWFAPQGRGYDPFMGSPGSGGGTWEDHMNQALLGTGYSVDDF